MFLEIHDNETGNTLMGVARNIDFDYQAEQHVLETASGRPEAMRWVLFADDGKPLRAWERDKGQVREVSVVGTTAHPRHLTETAKSVDKAEQVTAVNQWIYRWQDGAAVLTQRSPSPRYSRWLGELWLSADCAAGRYVWDVWDNNSSSPCWRSWIRHACEQSPSYVVDKLCYGHPSLYCPEESDVAVRRWIMDLRRSGGMSKEEARLEWSAWRDAGPPTTPDDLHPWVHGGGFRYDRLDRLVWRRFGYSEFSRHLPHLTSAITADLAT